MNGWESRLLAPPRSDTPLRERIELLLAQQRSAWPLLREGEAALDSIRTKRLFLDGSPVVVQANPGRSISTNAKVDPASIAARPCFLCPASLPQPERGIAFGDFIVLPNPYPILQRHVTIAYHHHDPQRLPEHAGDMLALAKALGPDMFVLYNGPRCGASAPDHMHFQACLSGGIPLFEQLPSTDEADRITPLAIGGRNLVACLARDPIYAQSSLQQLIAALGRIRGGDEEPMFNVIALYRDNRYAVAFFPREKHRSGCYFAQAEQRLSISPAAIEMAGIVVVADGTHFDRVDEAALRSMYGEVTIGNDSFSRLVGEINQ